MRGAIRCAFVLLLAWCNCIELAAQTPPEHVEAYVQLVKAEQEEKQGNWDDAIAFCEKSIALYQQVANDYPDWQPDVVRYRMAQAQNQLDRIRAQRDRGAVVATTNAAAVITNIAVVPPPPTAPVEMPVSPEALHREQLEELQRENRHLREDLERESAEVDDLSAMIDELQEQQHELTEANKALQAQLAVKPAAAPESAPSTVPRTVDESELALLRTENEELQREVEGLNRALERGMNPEDAEELRRQNTALTEELRMFRNQLVYSEQKIRELERQISKSQPATESAKE